MSEWPYGTGAWKRLRLAHLALEPLCRGCAEMNRLTPANTVDHVQAISDGGHPFPGHDGLASYCAPCHSAKTARGSEAGAIRSNKPRKGCDIHGRPLALDHPWREKSLNERVSDNHTLDRVSGAYVRAGIAGSEHRLSAGAGHCSSLDDYHRRIEGAVSPQARKSLVATGTRSTGDTQNQLISKGSRNGR